MLSDRSDARQRLSRDEFLRFREFLENTCGILIGDNKEYLITSRLGNILKERNLSTLNELIEVLHKSPHSDLKQRIVDAMTTNETMWMRDSHPYDLIKNCLLKEIVKRTRQPEIRIWSAACSTGQEPYSISMVVDEAKRQGAIPKTCMVKIIATDISRTVLEKAKEGTYDQRIISRGLPRGYLQKYFTQKSVDQFAVNEDIKRRIEFKYLNLKDDYKMLGKFDIVLCRNVLIYFSAELKEDILKRIHKTLRPEGYLFLGASESLNGLNEFFKMENYRPGIIYQAK